MVGMPGLPAIHAQLPLGFEWIILLVIVAIVLLMGPRKIPELAKGIGRALGEFRRGREEVERELRAEMSKTPSVSGPEEVVEINPRILDAAKELGLDVLGRKERTLKVAILNAVDKSAKAELESVAKALGLGVRGMDKEQIKDSIAEALGI